MLGIVLLWVATVFVLLTSAALHVRSGQQAVRVAQRHLTAAEISDPAAPDRLEPVRRQFAAARAELDNPAVWPLRVLPVMGRQLRAVDNLAGAATASRSSVNRRSSRPEPLSGRRITRDRTD